VSEYPIHGLFRIEVDGTALCLARTSSGFFAIADQCSHEGASLSEGDMIGEDVLCPMHNSRFDLKTGAVKGLPAQEPVASFAVTVLDGDIFIDA
jgi:3-phenylpropionate/trans-cinnamate dioxygenase ferredoxin subunit